jgi:hypothetical protein
MNYFFDFAFTYDIQLKEIIWGIDFNGCGNNDEPDDLNPDNGLPNPYDHGRPQE